MAGFTAALGIGIALFGAASQYSAQKKQERAAERQAELQARQAEMEKKRADIVNARTMRASLRSARIARGALVNQAGAAGLTGSSGFQGGFASLGAQEGVNVGAFAQGQQFAEQGYITSVGMAQTYADIGQARAQESQAQLFSGAGRTLFDIGGGFKELKKVVG